MARQQRQPAMASKPMLEHEWEAERSLKVAYAKRAGSVTTLIFGVITVLTIASISYWQFVYKPAQADNFVKVTYSGRVVNAQPSVVEAVPGSSIMISLDNGESNLMSTDMAGKFTIDLGKQKRGTRGKVVISANGFDKLERDFVIDGSNSHLFQQFRLEPQRK